MPAFAARGATRRAKFHHTPKTRARTGNKDLRLRVRPAAENGAAPSLASSFPKRAGDRDLRYNTCMVDAAFDPRAWRGMQAPSLAELEALAGEVFRRLPEKFRRLCADLVIRVDDFPSEEVIDAMRVESEFDLLGLFHGVGLPFRSESAAVQMPNMIWLYRRPILDYWAGHEETLGAIVQHVLVHEIGHHFGLSDAAMAAIESTAEHVKGSMP